MYRQQWPQQSESETDTETETSGSGSGSESDTEEEFANPDALPPPRYLGKITGIANNASISYGYGGVVIPNHVSERPLVQLRG
jgi:hypothetical protein